MQPSTTAFRPYPLRGIWSSSRVGDWVPSPIVIDRPPYIAFEGAEGCGKSTQAARLAAEIGAVLTRETGGTEIGAALREAIAATQVRYVDGPLPGVTISCGIAAYPDCSHYMRSHIGSLMSHSL